MQLSIIMTAYNEEKYLTRALDALLNQITQFTYEVICVDDGSQDRTAVILDQYQQEFGDRLVVVHQVNRGQGPARNHGIQIAQGAYIGFADADDWVEPDFVEVMCQSALNNQAEIVVCDVHKIFVNENREQDIISMTDPAGLIDITTYISQGQNNSYSWNKIYRRELWQQWQFKNMVYEDLDIIIPIISTIQRLAYVPRPLYNYYKHSGTTTSSYRNPRLFDIFTAYRDLITTTTSSYQQAAEFCAAKRILINMDTPGFYSYLGYFISLLQEFAPQFQVNTLIKQDAKVKEVGYYTRLALLPRQLWLPPTNHSNWAKFSYDEQIMPPGSLNQQLQQGCQMGGIVILRDLQVMAPFGILRAMGNFILFDEQEQVVAAGLFPEHPLWHALQSTHQLNRGKLTQRLLVDVKVITLQNVQDFMVEK